MTVCIETTIQKWNGHSSDIKPASAPEGSRFHYVDNGERYIFHNGMWVPDLQLINAIKMAAL